MNTTPKPTSQAGETPRAEETPRYFHRTRTEDELRKVLSMLCHFVWHRTLRPGEHMWSIPVDEERDFDCILSDGITELTTLRQQVKELQDSAAEYGEINKKATEATPENWRSVVEWFRAMAARFLESRDEMKHANRKLQAEVKARDEQIAQLTHERDTYRQNYQTAQRNWDLVLGERQALREALEKAEKRLHQEQGSNRRLTGNTGNTYATATRLPPKSSSSTKKET